MADKYKFRVGEKPVITVDLPTSQKPPIKRGPLWTHDEDEIPGRRKGGIRFYDCGWVWNGSEYELLPYLDPGYSTPIGDGFTNLFTPTDSSGWEQRDGLVLDYPEGTWTSTFKQIDNDLVDYISGTIGHLFWIFLNGTFIDLSIADESVWRNGVFHLPEPIDDQFDIQFIPMGELRVDPTDTTNNKITDVYDINADAVTVNLGNSFDVFIMPSIYYYQSSTTFPRNTVGSPVTAELDNTDLIVGHTLLYPRDVYYNASHPFAANIIDAGFGWSYNSQSGDLVTNYRRAYWQAVYSAQYLTHTGRAKGRNYVDPVVTWYTPDLMDFPLSSLWPPPPSAPDLSLSSTYQVRIDNNLLFGVDYGFIERLVAIIRKGGRNYYLWNLIYP